MIQTVASAHAKSGFGTGVGRLDNGNPITTKAGEVIIGCNTLSLGRQSAALEKRSRPRSRLLLLGFGRNQKIFFSEVCVMQKMR